MSQRFSFTQFLLMRVLYMVPVLLGISLVVFAIMHFIPGDPIDYIMAERFIPSDVRELIRAEYGLNLPLHVQYLRFIANAVRLDFGRSFYTRETVLPLMLSRMPITIELAIGGTLISLAIGVTLGVISAVKQYSIFDNLSMLGALFGVSMPSFWLALMLMYLFAVRLSWLPVSGRADISGLVLPWICLGIGGTAVLARLTRSSMLEVLRQDYIRTARAKGLRERVVVYKHALKNALIPVTTVSAIQFGGLLMGTVIIETVFAMPGIGRLTLRSIMVRDIPVVQANTLFYAFIFIFVNLIVDIIYGFIDPRIRYK